MRGWRPRADCREGWQPSPPALPSGFLESPGCNLQISPLRRMQRPSPRMFCKPSFKIPYLLEVSASCPPAEKGQKPRRGLVARLTVQCRILRLRGSARRAPCHSQGSPPRASFCPGCCLISYRSPLYEAANTDANDRNLAGESAPSPHILRDWWWRGKKREPPPKTAFILLDFRQRLGQPACAIFINGEGKELGRLMY